MLLSTLPARWRTILVLSLGLNLLVLGLVAGAWLDRRAHPSVRAEPLIWALPDADRAAIRAQLPRPDRGERRRRFRELIAALGAEPFDPAAARAALTRQRELGQARAARAEDALVDRLGQMSPEARAAYAQRLADRVRNGARRR
ncbi:periplasmic heavy metal sensor [Maribius pontilimi]|uniref:Periplasmic heavy metal sensor n=1 Tax=Palleronia pontilimi TaxID=1964209 RepID=A0A934IEK3_9RHOB|nr:periplasmic heavy metal sensor [Palleronia pontilimi]MBJ3761428.1 periplasmic heavy metal sensor [Palleronia pontilimi]